jgi:hypothetical protein
MTTYFDEKGKIFTPVIAKEPVAVIVQTVMHRITGNIHIHPEERIKDELDRPEAFLAVTEAKVFNTDGQEIHSAAFISINRQHIIWVLPLADLKKSHEQ